MHSSICNAIQSMCVIKFYYNRKLRIVEPYCYGRSTSGNKVLRGYQIGGSSSSVIPA